MADHKVVLALVNKARKALNLYELSSLPKGRRHDSEGCVVAKAINSNCHIDYEQTSKKEGNPEDVDDIANNYVFFGKAEHAEAVAKAWYGESWKDFMLDAADVQLPKPLLQFILDFDNKVYPELIDITNDEQEKRELADAGVATPQSELAHHNN